MRMAREELTWRKSSYSGGGNNSCVEVAFAADAVGVRDSKNTDGPRLAFSAAAWRLVRQVWAQ
jgi:hypothetical protein